MTESSQAPTLVGELPELEALSKGLVGQRHRRFVLEFVADPRRNATRAYKVAFGLLEGDKDESARVGASRLLRKDNIIKAISALQNKIRETALPRMLDKLEAIIHTELRDVMSWGPGGQVRLIPSDTLSPAASAALAMIQEVREERQGRLPGLDDAEEAAINIIRKSVKLHDPLKAMEIYAKLAGVGAPERIELSGLSERLERARAAGAAAKEGGVDDDV